MKLVLQLSIETDHAAECVDLVAAVKDAVTHPLKLRDGDVIRLDARDVSIVVKDIEE